MPRSRLFFPPSQSCVDWNRDVLKRELGLDDEDIIDLPILFMLVAENDSDDIRALAYYPDMVSSHMARITFKGPLKHFSPGLNQKCDRESHACLR